jgi:hypothetical protein
MREIDPDVQRVCSYHTHRNEISGDGNPANLKHTHQNKFYGDAAVITD